MSLEYLTWALLSSKKDAFEPVRGQATVLGFHPDGWKHAEHASIHLGN
jgi:hypothetical protein